MMKPLVICYFLFSSIVAFSQFGSQQIIADDAITVKMIRTGDIDGDNDLDVVAALFEEVVWYENLDGQGTFGHAQLIMDGLDITFSLAIADFNGDNFLDIVATSFSLDRVVWVANLDGLGNFGTPNILYSQAEGADDVKAADLDGDDDMDIIVNADINNTLYWFENLNGFGNFSAPIVISTIQTNGRSVFVGDIDGDLDLDLVSSSSGSVTISWFENLDGQGTFSTAKILAADGLAVEELYGADIDGDNDLDIVAVTPGEDKVSWYENLDGLGNFGSQQIISSTTLFPVSVYAADLDNDDDMDVLSISPVYNGTDEGYLAWFENLDGLGNFGPEQILDQPTRGARTVYAADLNGDTAMDVLAGLFVEYKVTCYENLTLGIQDNLDKKVQVYPNPANNTLYIDAKVPIKGVSIYTVLGEKIFSKEGNLEVINTSHLSSGLLFIALEIDNGVVIKKIFKE